MLVPQAVTWVCRVLICPLVTALCLGASHARRTTLHLPRSLVLAALRVVVVGSRVPKAARSAGVAALDAAGMTWTIPGRGNGAQTLQVSTRPFDSKIPVPALGRSVGTLAGWLRDGVPDAVEPHV